VRTRHPELKGILGREARQRVHEASLRILETVGIRVDSQESRGYFASAGAMCDPSTRRVTIPRKIVEKAVELAPMDVRMCNRAGEVLRLQDGVSLLGSQGSALVMFDYESQCTRPVSEQDVMNFARVADALSSIQIIQLNGCVAAASPGAAVLLGIRAVLSSTRKHCLAQPLNAQELGSWVGACQQLSPALALQEWPILSAMVSTTSPLCIDSNNAEMIVQIAKLGIPLVVISAPLAGATAPFPLSATLAVLNAEILGTLVLAQAVHPRTPFVYGNAATIMDMSTGRCAYGAIEARLLVSAVAELARGYHLPLMSAWSGPDSFLPDQQCGIEKASTILVGMLAGVSLWLGAGGFGTSSVSSLEQLIIDSDLFQSTARLLKGIDVCDRTLSLAVVKSVGPGGTFLTTPETLEWLRSGEHYHPQVFNRAGPDGPGILARAHEKVRSLLASGTRQVPQEEVLVLDEFVRAEAERWGVELR